MARFSILSDEEGYDRAIKFGDQIVLHLAPGTLLNDHYLKWVVGVLNGKRVKPPDPPKLTIGPGTPDPKKHPSCHACPYIFPDGSCEGCSIKFRRRLPK